jgi:serine/threonine protein kinase
MSPQEVESLSTVLFCRTTADGLIAPDWDESRDAELIGNFEVGLTVAGRYFLTERLGDGAMGRVFLAKDLRLDRPVAMKVIPHSHPEGVDLEMLLQREAKLGANLHHKGIAAVYDFGFHGDKSYTIFEYVEGQTLRELIRRRVRIPFDETLHIVNDLAIALDFAHIHGVVHRDLKPENICFTKAGEFKILDLGLARFIKHDLETGTYSGTPAYSSPEQAACRPTDGKSDQYALALIVFEMLTGSKAFASSNPIRLLHEHIAEPPPRPRELLPELPHAAERAILRALSKKPEDRFASCQEFARELGRGADDAVRTPVVPIFTDHRIGFYLAHVAEESLLARQLGRAVEAKHYSCWYYGRNAIPGVSFFNQAQAAIERSQAVILLVSRAALQSIDFHREIEHAHKIARPLLPLLIDISREEFEHLAPSWCRIVASSPKIEYRRNASLDELVERIEASAEALAIAIDEKAAAPPADFARLCTGQIWATDANQIDIVDLEKILFHNDMVDGFLNGRHRHFISATKGFGKTLLLTYKRHLLTRSSASRGQLPTMVPEGRPYLDFMSEMRLLSSRYEEPLADVSTTKRIWSAALRISVISHQPAVIDESEATELDAFPNRIQRWLGGAKIQPTVVFKELTTLGVSELNRLIDRTENFLDHKMRQIHEGMFFFVDKVDQAIRHLSQDAWIAVQAGLIEAAWETMNANSHLKIYASIRQEAFSSYQSDIKSNLFAATTSLHYSADELHALLDRLAQCYEGCPTFADFLGLNVVRHGRRPAPEDGFQYVLRHSCGRPRDLVAIASAISSKRSTLNESGLREIVQQTCSDVVISNLFDEVRVFLNCLGDRDARLKFLAKLPGNILQKSEAIRVCEEFNGLEPGTLQHFGEESSDIFHPFRDLYFVGLLGVVQRDPETGEMTQRFRRPHDPLAPTTSELPETPVYLIHPALDTFIRRHLTRTPFIQFQHIRVGDCLVWQRHFTILMEIERNLRKVEDEQFVDLTHQVVKRVQSLINSGTVAFGRIEIETSQEWKTLCDLVGSEASYEVLLWLEELLGEL